MKILLKFSKNSSNFSKIFPKFSKNFFLIFPRLIRMGVNFSQKFFLLNRGDCPPYFDILTGGEGGYRATPGGVPPCQTHPGGPDVDNFIYPHPPL